VSELNRAMGKLKQVGSLRQYQLNNSGSIGDPRTEKCALGHFTLTQSSAHRVERRSMSLEASGPRQMIHGASAVTRSYGPKADPFARHTKLAGCLARFVLPVRNIFAV